jgi:ABC-type enterobactin transport system permease subunit
LPPSLVNLPNRKYWLTNPQRREVAIDRVAGLIGWVAAATTALLAVAIELVLQANLHRTNFDNVSFIVVMVAYFVFLIVVVVRKIRLLRIPE